MKRKPIVWKEIPGYDGLYLASTGGEIWSAKRQRKLRARDAGKGYLHVSISHMGRPHNLLVSRAVLLAHVGAPPTGKHHAAHLNDIRDDNRLENLAWVTALENEAQKTSRGRRRRGSSHQNAKLNENAVLEIRSRIAAGQTASSIASAYGVADTTILAIKRGVNWSHVGPARYERAQP